MTIEVICPQVNSSAGRFLLTSGGDGEASSVVWIVLSTFAIHCVRFPLAAGENSPRMWNAGMPSGAPIFEK